jgi:hypothetical protein
MHSRLNDRVQDRDNGFRVSRLNIANPEMHMFRRNIRSFGATLHDGMKRIADAMARAERSTEEGG